MDPQKTIEMTILCQEIRSDDLALLIKEHLSGNTDVPQLHIKSVEQRFRIVDPTVLVAIVGVSGTALGALISELLKIAQQKKGQRILIQGKNGAKLEIPADTKPEKLDKYLEILRRIEAPEIYL